MEVIFHSEIKLFSWAVLRVIEEGGNRASAYLQTCCETNLYAKAHCKYRYEVHEAHKQKLNFWSTYMLLCFPLSVWSKKCKKACLRWDAMVFLLSIHCLKMGGSFLLSHFMPFCLSRSRASSPASVGNGWAEGVFSDVAPICSVTELLTSLSTWADRAELGPSCWQQISCFGNSSAPVLGKNSIPSTVFCFKWEKYCKTPSPSFLRGVGVGGQKLHWWRLAKFTF